MSEAGDVGQSVAGGGVTVAAVGDLMLGDSSNVVGFGLRSVCRTGEGLEARLSALRPLFRRADIVFGNLECVLSDRGLNSMSWRSAQMRGRPEYSRALANVGFTVLNLANNHAMQHGPGCFRDTVSQLRDAGIACCGLPGTDGWCAEPLRIQAGRATMVGVLGYCLRPRQYGRDTPLYAEGSEHAIIRDVESLRPDCDYVIVSLHWGEEFVDRPSSAEVRLAHALVEAGASLILGHHPHVPRPIETYGAGTIAYSLGNCLSDMVWYSPLTHGLSVSASLDQGVARVETTWATALDSEYAVSRLEPLATMGTPDVIGLDPETYERRITQTLNVQRRLAYLYALRNATRYEPRILAQMVGTTLVNKVRGVTSRLRMGHG